MENKLLEVENGYTYYCNNCKAKFTFVYTFNPIPGAPSYYICSNCNSILPTKDLKKLILMNCIFYYCCYPFQKCLL